jgi:exportin-2 (importin alpha re-exporter)
MAIFPPLLTPIYWERAGLVPALTRLLTTYLTKAGGDIVAAGHLTGVLGVFQKLIASKANDQYGFALLTSIIETLPLEGYQQYLGTIWGLLFSRLQVRQSRGICRGMLAGVNNLPMMVIFQEQKVCAVCITCFDATGTGVHVS